MLASLPLGLLNQDTHQKLCDTAFCKRNRQCSTLHKTACHAYRLRAPCNITHCCCTKLAQVGGLTQCPSPCVVVWGSSFESSKPAEESKAHTAPENLFVVDNVIPSSCSYGWARRWRGSWPRKPQTAFRIPSVRLIPHSLPQARLRPEGAHVGKAK